MERKQKLQPPPMCTLSASSLGNVRLHPHSSFILAAQMAFQSCTNGNRAAALDKVHFCFLLMVINAIS
jgi:hypothetical protein